MAGNHEGICTHCNNGCIKCAGQHHQAQEIKHYQKAIIQVPRNEIETLLNLSVCDEVREIAGGWLK